MEFKTIFNHFYELNLIQAKLKIYIFQDLISEKKIYFNIIFKNYMGLRNRILNQDEPE